MRRLNKKGEMNSNAFIGVVAAIAVGLVVIVVISILLSATHSSSVSCGTGNTYNSTDNTCQNASGAKQGKTFAGNITDDGLTFLDNTTSQFGTAGTVLGVSLLLLIIAGIGFGGYFAYKKYR